ncbi:hypothetical protein [Clostridium septicum]|uniref:hypothetical protein n=1 Tax=Clostridium septicum TaxID=1504 RepID=UPI000FF8CFC3|nr:hypothetical protein [Clostridium septicum]QAS59352.1 hypothetical protein EI377_00090 [Clostridium septicum]
MGYLPEIANKIKNGERFERIVDSIRGAKGGGNLKFKEGYDKHIIDVEDIVRKKNKGVVGGHITITLNKRLKIRDGMLMNVLKVLKNIQLFMVFMR